MSPAVDKAVIIRRPNMERGAFKIIGTAPLVQHRFGAKALEKMRADQEGGQAARNRRKRTAKDFQAAYQDAQHVSADGGWYGIPAPAFRNAMISACRLEGFPMTRAKLSIFCEADGFAEDGTPLVRITSGEPRMDVRPARNSNGEIDLRARPMFMSGWGATVRLKWDGDQFNAEGIANLLMRVGEQVGLLEGRHDSKKSAGMGWGTFELVES